MLKFVVWKKLHELEKKSQKIERCEKFGLLICLQE
jgi:hypothetical protein